jgi:hypothetical protein
MVALGKAAVPEAAWSRLDAFHDSVPPAALQVSSGLLQWAEHPLEVLRRWRAAVQAGGRMVHAVPCEPCLAEWRALVRESPVTWRDPAGWYQLFAEAGLRVRRHQVWTLQPEFPSALALARAFHQSGVTGRVGLGPGRLRAALRAYDERYRSPAGVLATWAWLAVEAVPA